MWPIFMAIAAHFLAKDTDAAHAAGIWMGKTESSEADTVIAFIELYIYNHAQL